MLIHVAVDKLYHQSYIIYSQHLMFDTSDVGIDDQKKGCGSSCLKSLPQVTLTATTILYMCVHHTQGNAYHLSNLHSS